MTEEQVKKMIDEAIALERQRIICAIENTPIPSWNETIRENFCFFKRQMAAMIGNEQ
jgi:hypothetical protein